MKLFRFDTDNYINAGVNICLKLVSEEVAKIYYIYYHWNKQSYRKVSSSVLQDILRIFSVEGLLVKDVELTREIRVRYDSTLHD